MIACSTSVVSVNDCELSPGAVDSCGDGDMDAAWLASGTIDVLGGEADCCGVWIGGVLLLLEDVVEGVGALEEASGPVAGD